MLFTNKASGLVGNPALILKKCAIFLVGQDIQVVHATTLFLIHINYLILAKNNPTHCLEDSTFLSSISFNEPESVLN